jgi:glycosyltransferase involved in cell wall biosynthesis
MTFSIIVPVHNGEKFIEDSVMSALEQSFDGDFEVIIVENGSSDATPSICDRLAAGNDRVTVLHRGAIGLYMARQEGIKAAKGDYIVALDADDRLDKELLSELSSYIEGLEDGKANIDLVIYNAADMDSKATLNRFPFEEGKVYRGEDKKVFKDLVCSGDSLNAMWIKCIKRDVALIDIEKNGLNYGEDLFQTAYYVDKADGIAYLDKNLYYYRVNEASLTATYSESFMENQKFVWSQVDRISENWNDSSYKEEIDLRKALTCTINMAKLIYSDLGIKEKKEKLKALMEDSFYRKYALRNLPEWAPEESVFVHGLMKEENAFDVLIANARKSGFKKKIKKLLGK